MKLISTSNFSPVLGSVGCGLQATGHGLLGVECGMRVAWSV